MAEFVGKDLTGSHFENVDLTGAEFAAVDLSQSRFKGVDFRGVVMNGVELSDVTINGEFENLVLNGVDVAPLVEAELDRRDPDRVRMRPTDPTGVPGGVGHGRAALGRHRRAGAWAGPGAAARVGRRRVVLHRDLAPPGVRNRRVGPPRNPR